MFIEYYNDARMPTDTLPEDGFTTNSPRQGYYLTAKALRRVKNAARIAGLPWQSIAARPATAEAFCTDVEADYPAG